MVSQLRELNQLVSQNVLNFNAWLKNLRKTWQPFLSKVSEASKIIVEVLGEFGKLAAHLIQAYDRFYWILIQHGWPPPVNKLANLEEFFSIVAECEKNGVQAVGKTIETAMLRWHSKEYLKKMVDDWKSSPLLRSRSHILESAIKAHVQGEYVLAIPVFLTQIEGIIASGFRFTGWMNGKKLKEHLDSVLHEALIIKNENEAFRGFFTNILMATFFHGNSMKIQPNRHAILHGADIQYGTEANSLKLILVIENLRRLFRFESLENGGVFHIYGCPSVQISARKRIFYSSPQEAIRLGLKGCKRCHAHKYYR